MSYSEFKMKLSLWLEEDEGWFGGLKKKKVYKQICFSGGKGMLWWIYSFILSYKDITVRF